MSRYECDCGRGYDSMEGLDACQMNNHWEPISCRSCKQLQAQLSAAQARGDELEQKLLIKAAENAADFLNMAAQVADDAGALSGDDIRDAIPMIVQMLMVHQLEGEGEEPAQHEADEPRR